MKKISLLMLTSLMSMTMMAELTECKLYSTNFQDWNAVSSSTTPTEKKVTTRFSNEAVTITFCETQIAPEGTNAKFTKDFITVGYAMAAKTATPYFMTSELVNVTKVHYVHAATGSSRGWGLQYKTADDAEWVTVNSTCCEQSGTEVDVQINKEHVQLRWYNLNSSQNAYMTEFAIYGMAEDTGEAAEFTITYFDQDGKRLGDSIQTEDETLAFAFGEEDLTIPAGYKFRGWYDSGMKRHVEGEAIDSDLRLTALVTPIEEAKIGNYYIYNLTSNVFYDDDHECFIPANGAYHNEHGWHFSANGSISLPVAGNAYVKIGLCKYSAEGDVVVTTKSGADVTSFPSKVETDNTAYEFFYGGEADTLVLTFEQQAYIHNVAVYNVKEEAVKSELGYYELASGDAAALLVVIAKLQAGDKIFLPNGVYDLGETVLTTISKNNISIIGQSMEGVIIKNAPDYRTESINNTATLRIEKNVSGTYLQDLTLQNALDYYKSDNGRAVALWDCGTKTVCKNVRLLSYQDTYYSNLQGAYKYFEDCEIHGTVDYICGDGHVYFKKNLLYCEPRAKAGGGSDAITANNGLENEGYVFDSCTIMSECPTVSLGRAWNNTPTTIFLNTLVDYNAGNFSFTGNGIQRWTLELMNANAWPVFGEYNTHMDDGTVLTPTSNVVTFIDKKTSGNPTKDIETVLSAEQAATYSYANVFGSAWNPAEEAKQAECEKEAQDLEPDAIYLAEEEGKFVMLLKGSDFFNKLALYNGKTYTLRKANARGGFGKKANQDPTAIGEVSTEETITVEKKIVNGQLLIIRDGKQYNAQGAQL